MTKNTQLRAHYLMGLLLSAALFGGALILQFYAGLAPCTLCIIQRAALGALCIIFLLGALLRFNKIGHYVLGALGTLFSVVGIIFSARQAWLHHFPVNGAGDCSISLRYLFKIFSFTDALQQIWHGGSECSEQGWEFLHLSMAEWSLIWFVIFLLIFLAQIRRTAR